MGKKLKCLHNHRSASLPSFQEDGDGAAFVEDLVYFTWSVQPSSVTKDQTLIPAVTYLILVLGFPSQGVPILAAPSLTPRVLSKY